MRGNIRSDAVSCLSGKRVLVVEDKWVVGEALKSLLEETGMVVSGPAASVADAERLISEQIPQLAVVDLNLNGEMAHDLINRLHELHIPAVLVTGLVSKLPEMVAATLQKPFSGAELLETLCNVVDSNHLVAPASVAAR